MFLGQRPDITPAQIVAVVGNVIAVAVAFGANITAQQQNAILALATVLGAFLVASDAHLRGRRAHASAIREAAAVQAGAPPAPATTVVTPAPAPAPAPAPTAPPTPTPPPASPPQP